MKKDVQNIQLACFKLGDRLFAIDIMRIKEIIPPQKLTGLPRDSALLEGVINLRGAVVPVMDMRHRFDMPKADERIQGKLLIVSLQRQLLALAVDEVMEVITVLAGELRHAPDTAYGNGMEYVLGICFSREQMFMILDIDSLFHPSDIRQESLRG
jgi:purine-binding chemotaxis protein CheW